MFSIRLGVIDMAKYCGYMGRVILLDLSARKAENYIWTDRDRELYIGGKAMASKIMYDNFTGEEDPLGPDNLLIIATGPLNGSFLPSTSRFDVSGLSPLTGITASSNCGGDFGLWLKKAGIDALILHGRCESPTWIEIDEGEIRLHDASALSGLRTGETQRELRRLFSESKGKPSRCGTLCIGPAGENYVNFASVFANGHSTGRAGFGAVLGWKNLKAIRIKGEGKLPLCDEERVRALSRAWAASLRETRREEGDNCCTACPLHCARQGRGEDPLSDALGMDAIAAGRAAERFAGSGLSREELFNAMAHGRIDVNERRSGERENKLKSGKRRKGSFEAVLRAFELPDDEESALFCRRFTEAVSVSGQCMFTLKALRKGELPMLDMLQAVTGKPYTLEDFLAMGEESLRLERELKARFEK